VAGWVCYNQTWLYFSPNNSILASLGHRKLIDTNEALVCPQGFVILPELSCRGGPRAIVAVVIVASRDGCADGLAPYNGPGACSSCVWVTEIFNGDGVIALGLFMRLLPGCPSEGSTAVKAWTIRSSPVVWVRTGRLARHGGVVIDNSCVHTPEGTVEQDRRAGNTYRRRCFLHECHMSATIRWY